MRKDLLVAAGVFASLFVGGVTAHAEETQDMYRLYNPNSGEHFYTANLAEKANLVKVGWKDEGIGWVAPKTGDPVYRVYNPHSGDHHYTLDAGEKNHLVKIGWQDEGIGWSSDTQKRVPLFRLYNKNAKTASHHYTTSAGERDSLISIGWKSENVGWYGVAGQKPNTSNNQSSSQSKEEKMAREYFNMINQERQRKGLQPLIANDKLFKAGAIRAKEASVKFAHARLDGRSPSTVLADVGISNMFMGGEVMHEGIADVNSIFTSQKNSSAHYKVMMDAKYKYGGTGIYINAAGRCYMVTVFTTDKK